MFCDVARESRFQIRVLWCFLALCFHPFPKQNKMCVFIASLAAAVVIVLVSMSGLVGRLCRLTFVQRAEGRWVQVVSGQDGSFKSGLF